MDIRLLGPVELYSARGPVPIGSAKQRALLAFLALHPQRLLTYDVLIDGLWGQEPPDGTVQALRFHVSRLRGILRQVDDADRLRTPRAATSWCSPRMRWTSSASRGRLPRPG